jgi:hypothetical protein
MHAPVEHVMPGRLGMMCPALLHHERVMVHEEAGTMAADDERFAAVTL